MPKNFQTAVVLAVFFSSPAALAASIPLGSVGLGFSGPVLTAIAAIALVAGFKWLGKNKKP